MDITISRRRENYSRWNDVFAYACVTGFFIIDPCFCHLSCPYRLDIWKGLFCLEGFLKVVNYFPFFHVDIKERNGTTSRQRLKLGNMIHETCCLLAVAPRIPETLWNHIYYYYIKVCAENTLVYIKGVHFLKKVSAMFFWFSSLLCYFSFKIHHSEKDDH